MCRCIDLFNALCVVVVLHQYSVFVTFGVSAVVVLPDFIRQVLSMRRVEVSNGKVPVLPFVLYHWEQTTWPAVQKLMKSILSLCGIAQSHHVVVHAFLNVPHQQFEAVTRWWSTETTVLQLLLWIEGLEMFRRSQNDWQHQREMKQEPHHTLCCVEGSYKKNIATSWFLLLQPNK